MTDPLLDALRKLKDRGRAAHVPRRAMPLHAEGPVVEHKLDHVITFHQDCVLQRREYTRVDGELVPGPWLPEERYKAGEQVARKAGQWQIRVVQGTADFEKDFIPPAGGKTPRGEIED